MQLKQLAQSPLGFKLSTGPGYGGHCIPIDPFILAGEQINVEPMQNL